jgi:hypothetical protein
MMDIVERIIVYRDRPGRSHAGRELLAEAANEITALRRDLTWHEAHIKTLVDALAANKKAAGFPPPPVASTDSD